MTDPLLSGMQATISRSSMGKGSAVSEAHFDDMARRLEERLVRIEEKLDRMGTVPQSLPQRAPSQRSVAHKGSAAEPAGVTQGSVTQKMSGGSIELTPRIRLQTVPSVKEAGDMSHATNTYIVRPSGGERLWLSLDVDARKRTLIVKHVNDGLDNSTAIGNDIRPGDHIVRVNTVRNDARRMLDEVQKEQPLELELHRAPVPDKMNWEIKLKCMVEGRTFKYLSFFLGLINIVFLFVAGTHALQNQTETAPVYFDIIQHVMLGLFTIEMFLRLLDRRRTLCDDMATRVSAVFYVVILLWAYYVLLVNGQISGITIFWLFPTVVNLEGPRFMRHIEGLLVLVGAIVPELVAAFMLLGCAGFVFALPFIHMTTHYLVENDHNDTKGILRYFSSVDQAAVTVLQANTGGLDWHELYDAVGDAFGFHAQALLLGVIFFFQIAFFNIITGIVLNRAMLRDQEEQKAKQKTKLENFLKKSNIDKDADGCISIEEMRDALQHNGVKQDFEKHGMSVLNAEAFVNAVIQAEIDPVEFDDFVDNCMRVRRPASMIDVLTLIAEVNRLRDQVAWGTVGGFGGTMRRSRQQSSVEREA